MQQKESTPNIGMHRSKSKHELKLLEKIPENAEATVVLVGEWSVLTNLRTRSTRKHLLLPFSNNLLPSPPPLLLFQVLIFVLFHTLLKQYLVFLYIPTLPDTHSESGVTARVDKHLKQ